VAPPSVVTEMTRAAADRNMLFGILAVQMDFVAADALIAAMNAWVLDKERPLGSHLIDAGALKPDTQALIQALVDKHIEQHGGRVEQSLAAISSVDGLRRDLSQIADADVQTSLAQAVLPTPRGDLHATVPLRTPAERSGDHRFHVLRPHASGGLGKVSVARDDQLNREVALKELHDRHADNPNSRARFVQEAEITGGLEHPGVVPIYGLGQYADGRPFYAMRFIRGDSLGQAIERFHAQAHPKWSNPLDMLQLRRLLGRLIDVCNAMEYAHSRGVLHRDLKPGNIMLGRYGETLVVDWGLAKPLGREGDPALESCDVTPAVMQEAALLPQSGSGSAPTQMGSAVGTPAFMSPEQAAGRIDQLGPSSDVYSLGATLYMLLTGRPPQEDGDLGEIIQRVQRGLFPRPRELKPAIPRPLEAICLKAMALAPEERYASPRGMADDVEAWLADEPVSAMREPWTAAAWRWVKKHRTLVSSAAAMLMVAVVTMTAGNVLLNAANNREREAKNAAIAAKESNDKLLEQARGSLERFETLSQREEFGRHGMEPLRRELQEVALEYYATIAEQAGETEQARADRGDAYHRLGSTLWNMGRLEDGMQSVGKSLDIYTSLEKEFPKKAPYQLGAALSLAAVGELMLDARRAADAAEPLAQSRQRLAALHQADPQDFRYATLLAYNSSLEGERLRQVGQMEEAAKTFAGGVALLRSIDRTKLDANQQRDVKFRLARALYLLATLESQTLWRFAEARETYRESQMLMRELFETDPANGDLGLSLAQILGDAGDLEARENRLDDARMQYTQALEVMNRIEAANPDVPSYRQQTAELLHSLGTLHNPLSSEAPANESLAQLEQAVAIGAVTRDQFPEELDRAIALARFHSSLGAAYWRSDREADAQREFDAAVALLEELGKQLGGDVDTLYTLAEMQATIADQLAEVGRPADALAALDSADKNLAELAELAPDFKEVPLSQANVHISRSNLYEADGRLIDAIEEIDRLTAKTAEVRDRAGVEWLESSLGAMSLLAKTARLGYLIEIREGRLGALADDGKFDVLTDQAQRLPKLTREASDHYIAAEALAYGSEIATQSEHLAADQRDAVADRLAADAVRQLEFAWLNGYLRRSGGFSNLLSNKPTLRSVRESQQFDVLRQRPNFSDLLRRIETETPPQASGSGTPADVPPATDSKP
jgi:eukaryotic-like serine/threonine-protein kinase